MASLTVSLYVQKQSGFRLLSTLRTKFVNLLKPQLDKVVIVDYETLNHFIQRFVSS